MPFSADLLISLKQLIGALEERTKLDNNLSEAGHTWHINGMIQRDMDEVWKIAGMGKCNAFTCCQVLHHFFHILCRGCRYNWNTFLGLPHRVQCFPNSFGYCVAVACIYNALHLSGTPFWSGVLAIVAKQGVYSGITQDIRRLINYHWNFNIFCISADFLHVFLKCFCQVSTLQPMTLGIGLVARQYLRMALPSAVPACSVLNPLYTTALMKLCKIPSFSLSPTVCHKHQKYLATACLSALHLWLLLSACCAIWMPCVH